MLINGRRFAVCVSKIPGETSCWQCAYCKQLSHLPCPRTNNYDLMCLKNMPDNAFFVEIKSVD